MARSRNPAPKYELHKRSGNARVRWCQHGVKHQRWLGRYNTPESLAEYQRVLAEIRTAAAPVPVAARARVTVDDLLLAFARHADRHYRGPDGKRTSEFREYSRSTLHLRRLYGHVPATEFGPIALQTVRAAMIAAGWCRGVVNKRVVRVRSVFRWGVSQELVPVAVVTALGCVEGLQKGRSEAPEAPDVEPVSVADVNATVPLLDRHQGAMVRLQLLTGMRPGEVCALRLCDLDRSQPVWVWRPEVHKTAWREKEKAIFFGPKAQELIAEFLTGCLDGWRPKGDDWLFSPFVAREERFHALRLARKTNVQPSQAARRKANPARAPGARFQVSSYDHAIAKACARAQVPVWSPNQLRHTFATEVRRAYGLEAAQVLLGHATADVTQIYAERNLALALKVAGEIG